MNTGASNQLLRELPSTDAVMRRPEVKALCAQYGRATTIKAVREILGTRRKSILSAKTSDDAAPFVPKGVSPAEIRSVICNILKPSLRNVINATGIIVHTNLGRAPLAKEAMESIIDVACSYSNLEYDVKSGARISRSEHVESLLQQVSGAECGMVVNNNAAAILLCLNTLARGREIIISRGELIEIGGSFRIPEILAQSGARLVEVGTTNRTHMQDYRGAITGQTAVLLRAHTSNYKIIGFTAEVALPELVRLGQEFNIPVVFDMGSGNLMDLSTFGLHGEPTIQDAVKSGVDVITFSGDKLLGGPQAGIIIGKQRYLQAMKNSPLARALRIDKLTLAGLEATLQIYANMPENAARIPVLSMLTVPESMLKRRAQRMLWNLKKALPSLDIEMIREVSQVGGGAYPMHTIPTWALALNPSPLSVNACEELLRASAPPVIARISRDRLVFDTRTLLAADMSVVVKIISDIFKQTRCSDCGH